MQIENVFHCLLYLLHIAMHRMENISFSVCFHQVQYGGFSLMKSADVFFNIFLMAFKHARATWALLNIKVNGV